MSLNYVALDHNCNVIRRQLEDEFRSLTALFIVHKSGEREKTIIDKRNMIMGKPYGRKIYELLLLTKEIHNDISQYLGLIVHQHTLFGMDMKRHYTAVFFINADRFHTDANAQHYLYHLAWHALTELEKISKSDNGNKIEHGKLIKPEADNLTLSKHNLMADIFGAFMMEIQGHNNYILELAQRRSLEPLTDIPENIPETFPFPIAFESCKLVYDDLKSTIDIKSRLIKQIMELASEVAFTYDSTIIHEWWSFCKPAQDMAWQGLEPEQILGYAIYTCEDTFVRAFAYQIAELMDIDPEPNIDADIYNAFAADEHNEKIHLSKSSESIKHIMPIAALQGNPEILRQEAINQNEALKKNKLVCGWYARALDQTADHLETLLNDEVHIPAHQLEAFCQQKQAEITWDMIKMLHGIFHQLIRRNIDVDTETLIRLLTNKNAPSFLIEYFLTSKPE